MVSIIPLLGFIESFFNFLLFIFFELVLEFFIFNGVSDRVDIAFELVLSIDCLSDLLIFALVLFGFLDEFFDFFSRQSSLVVGDGDLIGFLGALVDGLDVHDTVFINIKENLDLWNASGGRGDTIKLEFTERVVILGHRSLTFEYLNEDTWLVVDSGSEDLALRHWLGCVSLNQLGHDTTLGFNT